MEGVRDHVVSKLHENRTPFAMWTTLIYLFQSSNDARKLELRDKLRGIQMQKNEIVPQSYLNSLGFEINLEE